MKRNYLNNQTPNALNQKTTALQIAFHEAGHAAAIHLSNLRKNLPPVFFQINLRNQTHNKYVARIEDGRLIQNLPFNILESSQFYSTSEQDSFKCAFEADIVNLLAGPLAEAKYIALKNKQTFNLDKISLEDLHEYGGTSDLETIQEYLENFIADKQRQTAKMTHLLKEAFEFVNAPIYWQAIERLAHFICNTEEDQVSCETVINILDA